MRVTLSNLMDKHAKPRKKVFESPTVTIAGGWVYLTNELNWTYPAIWTDGQRFKVEHDPATYNHMEVTQSKRLKK